MTGLNLRPATVEAIVQETGKAQVLTVSVGENRARAVNYLELGERVEAGQQVVVNTTAVDMNLGSGGCHFVIPAQARMHKGWGHLMKLRYTPLQLRVNSAEEQDSPWHHLFQDAGGLEGAPVLAAELHSMVAPLALALRALNPAARIVYVATEGGALPAAFSRNTAVLKELGVISRVITAGHAFGGDLETINIFTGLQAAGRVARADYVIAAMGPGIAGTGTVYGFSGMEQGTVLQAAYALGGQAILVPRIGFADSRQRHRGISHHSLTVLTRAYLGPVWVPLPLLPQAKSKAIWNQARGLPKRCRRRWLDGSFIAQIAEEHPDLFASMGRSYRQNPEFFMALGAAARLAVNLDRSKTLFRRIAIK
ncbi:MAG: DUF3866 family protein [Eubacteriales bacterium]|nr:DUF3866 family protein [Eubacteriales bacterium]